MKFTYSDPQTGQTHTVTLEAQPDGGFVARIGNRAWQVRATPDGAHGWRLQMDGQPVRAFVAADGAARFVKTGANPPLLLTLPDRARPGQRRTRAGATATDDATLSAQMPGQIIDVYVQPGDRVNAGQAVAVLEAMKMETRVTAPLAGVVRAVYVQKGDVVERDQRLLDVSAGDEIQGDT